MRSRAVLGTSPRQSSNQETLWNISAKPIFALDVDFRFLLCKKSGSLLISGPLPNSEAKGWDLPLGVELCRSCPITSMKCRKDV
jgi:hypothetical protein